MKVLAWVLSATVLAAPAVAVCACEPALSPAQVPMNCEGTAGCCCGDPQAPSPDTSDRCPLAEKALDGAENVAPAVMAEGVDAPLLEAPEPPLPAGEAFLTRLEALSRASPLPLPQLTPTPLLL